MSEGKCYMSRRLVINVGAIVSLAFFLVLSVGVCRALDKSEELNRLWNDYGRHGDERVVAGGFPYMECFKQSAKKNSVPLSLLLAVARAESDFNPNAVADNQNTGDCYGIMQLKWPVTARDELGFRSLAELMEPCGNIDGGARYLAAMIKLHNGNYHKALAAYNQGPGAIPARLTVSSLPAAGVKYSSLVFHHLRYVLAFPGAGKHVYEVERKYPLIAFDYHFRVMIFSKSLKEDIPELRLDWFSDPEGKNQLVLLYKDEKYLNRCLARIKKIKNWDFSGHTPFR